MRGRAEPLDYCDHECAMANGCTIGGYQCEECELFFCIEHVDMSTGRTLCDKCLEEFEDREEEEEEEK